MILLPGKNNDVKVRKEGYLIGSGDSDPLAVVDGQRLMMRLALAVSSAFSSSEAKAWLMAL